MNKKLAVAILLPGLSACAGHSVRDSMATRKPSSARVGKVSADQVKLLVQKSKNTQAIFENNANDPDAVALNGSHVLQVFVTDNSAYPILGTSVQIKDSKGQVLTQTLNKNGLASFKLYPGTFSVHAEGSNLASPLDSSVTLVGAGAHSLFTMNGDEKGNGANGPQSNVFEVGVSKVVKTETIDASALSNYQKPFSSGQWSNVGEMCKWQRMPWDGNNAKKLSFGDAVLSPEYVTELSLGCNVYQGTLTPKAKMTISFISGAHSYTVANGSKLPDDSNMSTPNLRTDTPGSHDKNTVYSFNIFEGATQPVVLKAPTTSFYFNSTPADPSTPQLNAFDEDLVGHTVIGGTDFSFVSYQIKEVWIVTTLNDGTSGNPAKDGTAMVQKLMLLLSGKTGYPIIGRDQFSSTVDPDTFEVAVRANQIAHQNAAFAQDPLNTYVSAYAQAEAAQAGPEDTLLSWNYYRVGTQSMALLKKLYGDDNLQELDFSPLNSGPQWMSQMGLSFGYTKSPSNNIFTWKNALQQNQGTTVKISTLAPRWGDPGRTEASPFGTIQNHFLGALQELEKYGSSLGSGQISTSDVQSLVEEAKKNIAQTSQ